MPGDLQWRHVHAADDARRAHAHRLPAEVGVHQPHDAAPLRALLAEDGRLGATVDEDLNVMPVDLGGNVQHRHPAQKRTQRARAPRGIRSQDSK